MDTYLKLLGIKGRDLVTGFEGIVTSISFDLYGCVCFFVSPEIDKEGKKPDGHWFDEKRFCAYKCEPVMQQPTFALIPGPENKPALPNS